MFGILCSSAEKISVRTPDGRHQKFLFTGCAETDHFGGNLRRGGRDRHFSLLAADQINVSFPLLIHNFRIYGHMDGPYSCGGEQCATGIRYYMNSRRIFARNQIYFSGNFHLIAQSSGNFGFHRLKILEGCRLAIPQIDRIAQRQVKRFANLNGLFRDRDMDGALCICRCCACQQKQRRKQCCSSGQDLFLHFHVFLSFFSTKQPTCFLRS